MRPRSLTFATRFPRQIYGGIGIGVAVAAALSILALSNVSRVYIYPFFHSSAEFFDVETCVYVESYANTWLGMSTEIVHLDTRLQVFVAIRHCHLRSTGHHHDRRTPTRVSPYQSPRPCSLLHSFVSSDDIPSLSYGSVVQRFLASRSFFISSLAPCFTCPSAAWLCSTSRRFSSFLHAPRVSGRRQVKPYFP